MSMYRFGWQELSSSLVASILIVISVWPCEYSVDAFVVHNKFERKTASVRNNILRSIDNDDDNSRPDDDEPWILRSMILKGLDRSTEPQLLTEFLLELGACSTSITDHDRDTEMERPIFNEPDNEEIWNAAIVCGDEAVGMNVWTRCDITAHFPASVDLSQVADAVRYTFEMPTMPRYTVDKIPDKDWVKHVQSAWKPFVCTGNSNNSNSTTFVLTFPWHKPNHVQQALSLYYQKHKHQHQQYDEHFVWEPDSYVRIQLEGGIAFGTGEHPTTQLCLGWVADLYDNAIIQNDDHMFLDYGAGSGVLGIAACLCSSQVRAIGVEIDADAIRIADANAKTNKVNMHSYLPPITLDHKDDESASISMKARARTNLAPLPEDLHVPIYDACAANILARPLVSLADTIATMLKPGAKLGLSGILQYQANDVVTAYSEYFHDVKVQEQRGEWVLITGTRK